jgi:hypothetical protein
MTNTYALTDYDVYKDEENDNYGSKRPRRKARRRRRKLRRRKKSNKPILGRLPVFVRPITKGIPKRLPPRRVKIRPRIVRGRPMKLPPTQVRGLPIVPIRKQRPQISTIKVKKAPIVKTKTPISHLIRKTNPTVVKSPLSNSSKVEIKQLETAQIEASKKAMESDGKTSKLVKVVAIVGVVGVTGFGIYKFIQNKKISNGHISRSN